MSFSSQLPALPPAIQGVEYRAIAGFPEFPGYAVGSDGSVWSAHTWRGSKGWRELKPWPSGVRRLYLTITLHIREGGRCKGYPRLVHRLVLEAFVGPCPEGMECRHFPDRNPRNNRRENLRWGTPVENAHDQVVHGTKADQSGENSSAARLTWEQVRDIRKKKTDLMRQLATDYGVSERQIYSIWRNTKWIDEEGIK